MNNWSNLYEDIPCKCRIQVLSLYITISKRLNDARPISKQKLEYAIWFCDINWQKQWWVVVVRQYGISRDNNIFTTVRKHDHSITK